MKTLNILLTLKVHYTMKTIRIVNITLFNKVHTKVDWNNWVDEEDLAPSDPSEPSSNPNFDMEQFSQMMKQYQPIESNQDEDDIENEIIEEHTSIG